MDTCVCVCFGSVDGRLEGLTGCLQCSGQTGETFPDELTGSHVEHRAGSLAGCFGGKSAEKVKARQKRNENTGQAGLGGLKMEQNGT